MYTTAALAVARHNPIIHEYVIITSAYRTLKVRYIYTGHIQNGDSTHTDLMQNGYTILVWASQ